MDLQLAGQTVMVTGSTHGIGRRMAQMLADEGAQVVIAAERLRHAGSVNG